MKLTIPHKNVPTELFLTLPPRFSMALAKRQPICLLADIAVGTAFSRVLDDFIITSYQLINYCCILFLYADAVFLDFYRAMH